MSAIAAVDPSRLLDQGLTQHGDLCDGAAKGEKPEPQEF